MFCALLISVDIIGIGLIACGFAAALVGGNSSVGLLALHGGGGSCRGGSLLDGVCEG